MQEITIREIHSMEKGIGMKICWEKQRILIAELCVCNFGELRNINKSITLFE